MWQLSLSFAFINYMKSAGRGKGGIVTPFDTSIDEDLLREFAEKAHKHTRQWFEDMALAAEHGRMLAVLRPLLNPYTRLMRWAQVMCKFYPAPSDCVRGC